MSAPHADQIIDGYLSRLNSEANDLPNARREELLADVREHITEARASLTNESDADLLNILDRLGEPAELVDEARDRFGIQPPQPFKPGLVEVGALVLLPVFWIAGVVLLWASNAWNVRDKLIGTLLLPGGLWAAPILLVGAADTQASVHVCGAQPILAPTPLANALASASLPSVLASPITAEPYCSDQPAFSVLSLLLLVATIVVLVLPILTSIYLAIRLRRSKVARPLVTQAV